MRLTTLAIVAVILIGCSTHMGVRVDIFDTKGLNADDFLEATVEREAARHAYLRKTDLYAQTRVNLKQQVEDLLRLLSSAGCSQVPLNQVDTMISNGANTIDQEINGAISLRDGAIETARLAETVQDAQNRRGKFNSALDQFAMATGHLTSLRAKVKDMWEASLQECKTKADFKLINALIAGESKVETALAKEIHSLTGGFDLFDDTLAAAVISAPDQYWQGVFNQANASGLIGNTDIAIQMETIGTFTIKGLRLDASKVTEASFQVIKQSIRMAAAAYGISTPSGTESVTGNSMTGPSDVVLSTDRDQKAAEKKLLLGRQAALTLFDIIIADREALTSHSDTKRQVAVKRLKETFVVYKSQLSGQ